MSRTDTTDPDGLHFFPRQIQRCRRNVRTDPSHHRLKGITMTCYLVGDQQLRYAIHSAISTVDIAKQCKNYIIESTVKVSDEVLELLASSKTTES